MPQTRTDVIIVDWLPLSTVNLIKLSDTNVCAAIWSHSCELATCPLSHHPMKLVSHISTCKFNDHSGQNSPCRMHIETSANKWTREQLYYKSIARMSALAVSIICMLQISIHHYKNIATEKSYWEAQKLTEKNNSSIKWCGNVQNQMGEKEALNVLTKRNP